MASLSAVHAVSVSNLGSRILENGASSVSFRASANPNTLRGEFGILTVNTWNGTFWTAKVDFEAGKKSERCVRQTTMHIPFVELGNTQRQKRRQANVRRLWWVLFNVQVLHIEILKHNCFKHILSAAQSLSWYNTAIWCLYPSSCK